MGQKRSIKGIGVAPGLVMGPVHVVRATPHKIPTWSLRAEEIESEIARVHRALDTVSARLESMRVSVEAHAGEKDAAIIATHRAILQDPSAIAAVERRIRDDRLNAEACLQAQIQHLIDTFGRLEGDAVRSHGQDVADPWRRVLDELMSRELEEFVSSGERVVLAAAELTPHVVTCLDRGRVLAVVTEAGGRFSHGAVLARSFGFPCVVEVPNLLSRLEQGVAVIVDGDHGTVQIDPPSESVDLFLEERRRRQHRLQAMAAHAALPATSPDGHSLRVQVNIESVHDLDTFEIAHTDGVGLLRTEFLYMERHQFPSEEEQYRLYRRVVERMAGLPVTLRMLDIGGDKQLPYFKTPEEVNPALGWRGLRVLLEWQDLLVVQLRAALRASAHGDLRIMLPMVTSLEEVLRVREIFGRVRGQLLDQGYEVARNVPVGVMIEVPSSLLALEDLIEEVDFVSVGTNDLVQYLLAADRDNPWVSRLYDPNHPAVIRALQHVAAVATRVGKPSSVCGEMAGDHGAALLLAGMGFDAVSVAPHFVPEIKYAVRETTHEAARELARAATSARAVREVTALLEAARERLHTGVRGTATSTTNGERSASAGDSVPSEPT